MIQVCNSKKKKNENTMTIYNPRADFKDEFGWLKLEQIHEQVKDLTAHAFHSQWKRPSSVGQRAPTKASRASE